MGAGNSTMEMFLTFLKMSGAVLGVLGLAYLILNKGVAKLMGRPMHQGNMKVVDKCMLDQRNALFIVEVAKKQLLIASGQSGSNLICEIDIPLASESDTPKGVDPLPLFSNWLTQKKSSKTLPS